MGDDAEKQCFRSKRDKSLVGENDSLRSGAAHLRKILLCVYVCKYTYIENDYFTLPLLYIIKCLSVSAKNIKIRK